MFGLHGRQGNSEDKSTAPLPRNSAPPASEVSAPPAFRSTSETIEFREEKIQDRDCGSVPGSEALFVYYQMQHEATQRPDARVIFKFSSNDRAVLTHLEDFFSKCSQAIPPGFTLELSAGPALILVKNESEDWSQYRRELAADPNSEVDRQYENTFVALWDRLDQLPPAQKTASTIRGQIVTLLPFLSTPPEHTAIFAQNSSNHLNNNIQLENRLPKTNTELTENQEKMGLPGITAEYALSAVALPSTTKEDGHPALQSMGLKLLIALVGILITVLGVLNFAAVTGFISTIITSGTPTTITYIAMLMLAVPGLIGLVALGSGLFAAYKLWQAASEQTATAQSSIPPSPVSRAALENINPKAASASADEVSCCCGFWLRSLEAEPRSPAGPCDSRSLSPASPSPNGYFHNP